MLAVNHATMVARSLSGRGGLLHRSIAGIVIEAGDHYAQAGPMEPLAIPTSLQAWLLARLDSLAPTREVAQIGAALRTAISIR
jgi:hypothetical protein